MSERWRGFAATDCTFPQQTLGAIAALALLWLCSGSTLPISACPAIRREPSASPPCLCLSACLPLKSGCVSLVVSAMGLLSLLPDEYASVETWLKRIFVRLCSTQHPHIGLLTALQFFFGLVMIGPWVFLVIYDLVLYIFRSIAYEVPVVGGRARGKARPRAPSLTERPSGHRRNFSLARRREPPMSPSSSAVKTGSTDTRWRHLYEETHGFSAEIASHAE